MEPTGGDRPRRRDLGAGRRSRGPGPRRANHPERPLVLVAQQSRFDPTRAPEGKHTAWGYCHVPSGSDVDMTEAIESQMERFAPGFRDLILERHTMNAGQFEAHNPNYIRGDIAGGGFGVKKVFQLGATAPYRIGDGLFLCSSATPPGAGVPRDVRLLRRPGRYSRARRRQSPSLRRLAPTCQWRRAAWSTRPRRPSRSSPLRGRRDPGETLRIRP